MEENLPKFEDFTDSLVAFIDVLGFDQRARSIKDENDFLEVGKLLYTTYLTAQNLSSAGGILRGTEGVVARFGGVVLVTFAETKVTQGAGRSNPQLAFHCRRSRLDNHPSP